MKVCPFNKPGLIRFRLALWLAIHVPASRKFLIWLDDKLDFGGRNKAWKWWLDLEWRAGRLQQPPKTNQRDLRPERKVPTWQNITLYPADTVPPPTAQVSHPVQRPQSRQL